MLRGHRGVKRNSKEGGAMREGETEGGEIIYATLNFRLRIMCGAREINVWR